MSDFGEMKNVVARKQGRCEYCYRPIPKGEEHKQYKGMFDARWQHWKMHVECCTEYANGEMCDGFTPGEGEMPKRILLAAQGEKQ